MDITDAIDPFADDSDVLAKDAGASPVEQLPVFEFAGASERISDTSKTFDELRIEKSSDFPELEDGKKVSWTMEYGKISKAVIDAKGTSIGKLKTEIESSKAFSDNVKKAKDKELVCKVKPRVTAQSKGDVSAYKGVFTTIEDAAASGKLISVVPARNGRVYEVRNTNMGQFITPLNECDMLSEIKAGFIPALPLIPNKMLSKVLAFFRMLAMGGKREALVNIYWDTAGRTFVVDVPVQTVTSVSVESELNAAYECERYIHYMDIHSHHRMKAEFSPIDDRDEKATRLYAVIGDIFNVLPDIKVRISNGGVFCDISTDMVFEGFDLDYDFDTGWLDRISFGKGADLII